MTHLSRLEQDLQHRFILESRAQAPSGMHRRFLGRSVGSAPTSKHSLLISCATYPSLPDESVKLQKTIAGLMQASKSPVLMKIKDYHFDPDYHWIAADMPADPDLRSCLRIHQRFEAAHVNWLLGKLEEGLRYAVDQGWPRFSLDGTQILLNLETANVTLVMPDMPLFGFSTLSVTDTLQTMAFNPASFAGQEAPVPETTRDYVTPIAALCCEMLGATATIGAGQNERFRSIPVLTPHQNSLLRTALAGAQRHSFETLDEFVSQFVGSSEAPHTRHTAPPTARSSSTTTTATTPPPVTNGSSATASPPAAPTSPLSQAVPPPLPRPAPPPLSPLETLPAGYQLDRELRSVDSWRMVKATHATKGEVLITTLDLTGQVSEVQRNLANVLTSLQQSTQSSLLKPVEVTGDSRSLHVVRPMPSGRTLLDVLRQQRSLSRPSAARLLMAVHTAYETLWSLVPRRFMSTSLDQFWLPQANAKEEPSSSLLVLDASQVVIESLTTPASAVTNPINHFARLALSLLGQGDNSLGGPGNERFTPVPELSAEINGVLRRALMPDLSSEMTLPWLLSQLTASLAGHTAVALASRPVMQVPESFRNLPLQPANRMRLQPMEESSPTLALVADETFWLGRAGTHSDFVAQFRPRNPVNDNRTKCISRAQSCAQMRGGHIYLKDVSTINPSLAGSRRLVETEVVHLPVTLLLAGEYPLEIRSLKSAYSAPGPAVTGWPTAGSRPMRRGACAFKALDRTTLPFEGAWIFSDASLSADDHGHLTFDDTALKDSLVRFHFHGGCFWVEATSASRLLLNGVALKNAEMAPLQHDDEISIHNQIYKVCAPHLENVA